MSDDPRFQLRLGLVMKGGISLAVYMNGMVQEMLALVRASQARMWRGPGPEPAWVKQARAQNRMYYDLLAHYNADVIIDVIAGTSAGGLNGLVLGKALASGAPDLKAMSQLWIETAQIFKLAAYDRNPSSILSGQLLREQLQQVLEGLNSARPGDVAPAPEILDLFVTATDVRGHKWERWDRFNQKLEGKAHRYLFHLIKRRRAGDRGYDRDDFMSPDAQVQDHKDALLARIGAATSAFPGAFPPVQISRADAEQANVDVLNDVDETARKGIWFSDGGILLNSPFEPVLETILQRSADRPVRRVLGFLEPDPDTVTESLQPEPPTMLETGLGAVTVPMQQDILESLNRLQQETARRQKLQLVVEQFEEAAAASQPPAPSRRRQPKADRAAAAAAHSQDQAAISTEKSPEISAQVRAYRRARLEHLSELLGGSIHRALEGLGVSADRRTYCVDAILTQTGLGAGQSDDGPRGDIQRHLLQTHDPAFHERRLHFMLSRLHRCFVPGWRSAHPEDAKALLHGLWGALDDWNHATWMLGQAGRLATQAARWAKPAEALNKAFRDLAERLKTDDHPAVSDTAVALSKFMHEASRLAGDAESKALAHMTAALEPAPPATLEQAARSKAMAEALNRFAQDFESADLTLFPLQAFTPSAEYTTPSLVHFAPKNAMDWVRKDGRARLAGDALGHFGAFLDERWRANDMMWGRLDAAEILTRLVASEAAESGAAVHASQLPAEVQALLMKRRREILADFPQLIDPKAVITFARPHAAAAPKPKATDRLRLAYQAVTGGQLAGSPPAYSLDDASDDELAGYLTNGYQVGTEGLDKLPPRRLAAEIIMMLDNASRALDAKGPSWLQRYIGPFLSVVMRPLNWIARLLLLPRQGLLGVAQGNFLLLMPIVGIILVVLGFSKAIEFKPMGRWITALLLIPLAAGVPFLMRWLFQLLKTVIITLVATVGLALVAIIGVGIWFSLSPQRAAAPAGSPTGQFWLPFVGALAAYGLALALQSGYRWWVARPMRKQAREAEKARKQRISA